MERVYCTVCIESLNVIQAIWRGKLSQNHNYSRCIAKRWCLLAMDKLYVSAYSGQLQV